jgi:pimeloyl-ACP methyl ester carboxylesterase
MTPMRAPRLSDSARIQRLPHHGASLAYTTAGDGPVVLLLHGGLSDSETDFGHVIPRLATRFRVVAMDTRGHGRSSWGGTPLSYAGFAEDAAALLRHLGEHPAIVIGLSDGGIAGFHLALHHPALVRQLIAIGASADISGDTPLGGAAIRQYSAAMFAVSQPRRLARWQEISPGAAEVIPFIDALMVQVWRPATYITRAELAEITVPTALVLGDHDEYVTLAHGEELHRTIPGSVMAVVPECGHLIFESNPAAAWNVLERLLAGQPLPGPGRST